MRIAIAGETYYPGNNGQAIFTIHLAEGLAGAGHEVHVIAPSQNFGYEEKTIRNVRVHLVRSIPFHWIHSDAAYPFLPARAIQRIFSHCRPDILHIQDHYFLCRDAARVAAQMHIPVIGTNHFLPENLLPYLNLLPVPRAWKINVLWDLMLWTYNKLRLITTPTRTAAEILTCQNVRAPVLPVSCGVNTGIFTPDPVLDRQVACDGFGLSPDKVTFLYVGRLDGEKRIDLLLKALAQLKNQGRKDLHLAVAGQGAQENELKSLARSLKMEDMVRFLGYVPAEDLPRLYQTAHIFAMPSPEELQSIATLEAMASGRPVLAANARALPELVTQLENGYLFNPGQADSAARGMVYLADHPDDWERMGKNSRARAVHHSLASTICRYEAIYTQVIAAA